MKPINIANDREPWDRQPKESIKQYTRFQIYRDLGRTRTLKQAHEILTATGDTIKITTLNQTRYEFAWSERAAAWDAAQDASDRERLLIERRDMIKRHRTMATALLAQAAKALKSLKPEEMSPADIARFVDLATKVEYRAIGEPLQTVAITGPAGGPVQVDDLSDLTQEERQARLAEIATELAYRAGLHSDDDD